MEKILWVSILWAVAILQSCTKIELMSDCGATMDWQLGARDTFIISSTGGSKGLGLGNYKIVNQQLHYVQGTLDSILPNEKYLIANKFVTNFPQYLRDTPNQKWKGTCADTYTLGIEVRLADGNRQDWLYDSCPNTNAPPAVQCYFSEITKDLYLQ